MVKSNAIEFKGRVATVVASLFFVSVISGCSASRIRAKAYEQRQSGQYETGLMLLESALKDDPHSAVLRAGILQYKEEAVNALIGQASQQLSIGSFSEAEQSLDRARRLDPNNSNVRDLLSQLEIERKQILALAQATDLLPEDPKTALDMTINALRPNPRHRELTQLRRRLESIIHANAIAEPKSGLSETRPISLDFRDINIRVLLDTVTRNSGVNFVLDPDVQREVQVSVFLKSVSVEHAIDLITSTHGLVMKVLDDRTILIYPNTADKRRDYQEQVVRLFYMMNTEAKAAASFLRGMLKVREPYVDDRSNFIALRDSPENIALADRLLSMYDTPEPEVLLDVEVIEVSSTRLTNLGVKLPDSISLTPLAPASSATGLTLANIGNLTKSDIAVGIGSAVVNLKREAGDYRTLANPKIRAKNKEKARILVGDKVPVVTTTTAIGGFVSANVNYLDVGLKLEVTPIVFADNEVSISVALEVSSVSREIATAGGGLAYQIGTRSAATALRLRDGETQVLAGLLSNEERSSASRIPGLGDLPVAGRLFSSQQDNYGQTELVLAITPRVVRNILVPQIGESELWIGTEGNTRVKPKGANLNPGRNTETLPEGARNSANLLGNSDAAPNERHRSIEGGSQRFRSVQWAGANRASVGESITLRLNMNGPLGTDEQRAVIQFDAAMLQLTSVAPGSLLRDVGRRIRILTDLSKSGSSVELGISGQGRPSDGPSQSSHASGDLLELTFVGLAPGVATVDLASIRGHESRDGELVTELPARATIRLDKL